MPRTRRLALALLASIALAGCMRHAPPKVDEARLSQFDGRGYRSDERFRVESATGSTQIGERPVAYAWRYPKASRPLPVVIYLPGLGEAADAGERWRSAWAEAGYAVVSVQLLDADQSSRPASSIRSVDFDPLARERYNRDATASRLAALSAFVAQLQRGDIADPAPDVRLERSAVAIAGFDLGAYTAMLAAGELPKGSTDVLRLPARVAAVIALSPYADFSGSAISTRYQHIAGPVLSVSGDADTDGGSGVSSPTLRKAPFRYMQSPDAYLLWLGNASHAVLAGSHRLPDEATADAPRGYSQTPANRAQPNGRRGANAAFEHEMAMESMERGRLVTDPTERAMAASLIQGVTTAFLDAYLRKDAIALEWLQRDAGRWIGQHGSLSRK